MNKHCELDCPSLNYNSLSPWPCPECLLHIAECKNICGLASHLRNLCPQCHLPWIFHPINKDGEAECHKFEVDSPFLGVTR